MENVQGRPLWKGDMASRDLKEVLAFQAEGTANAKVLRSQPVWHVYRTAKKSAAIPGIWTEEGEDVWELVFGRSMPSKVHGNPFVES